ncbi:MAG: hypothetical protein AAGE52_32010 [Myxococcota bacterium]
MSETDMGYYKEIDGKKYDGELIEAAEKAVAGRGDGRISMEDAEMLLAKVKDGNAYTDVEKDTVAFIRKTMKWTENADAWFRDEIRKWAAEKGQKTKEANAASPRTDEELKDAIDGILREVRHEREKWDGAMATFRGFLEGELKQAARDLLLAAARRERLELQWKLEELVEEMAPAPKKEAKKEAPKDEPEAKDEEQAEAEAKVMMPLRPEDLVPIYDDPRGLMIHRHKTDGRWFLTQINPADGQPQTVELAAHPRDQIKAELAGSPYWVEKTLG